MRQYGLVVAGLLVVAGGIALLAASSQTGIIWTANGTQPISSEWASLSDAKSCGVATSPQNVPDSLITLANPPGSPPPVGTSYHFSLPANDASCYGGRTEVGQGNPTKSGQPSSWSFNPGDDDWIAWDVYFPSDYPINDSTYTRAAGLMQVHQNGGCNTPPFGLPVGLGNISLYYTNSPNDCPVANNSPTDHVLNGTTKLKSGQWYKMMMHVNFEDTQTGSIAVYLDLNDGQGIQQRYQVGSIYTLYGNALPSHARIGLLWDGGYSGIKSTPAWELYVAGFTVAHDQASAEAGAFGSGGSSPPPPPPPPDTTPPTVSVSAPAAGATLSGTTTLSANASDNVAVGSVQFKVDGANVGSADTTTPYSFAWDTTKVANGTHTVTAVATDTSGNTATATTVSVNVNNQSTDTQAPSVPTGLKATAASSSSVNVSWNASTDNVGVKSYKVFRNGSANALATITSPTLTYTDTTVSAGTTYTYTVSAQDAAGNSSAQSGSVSVTTPAASDTTPPSVPTGLAGTATSTTAIALTWNASTDNTGGSGLAGYHLYRGSTLIASPTTTSFTDTGLTAATAYTYTVSAYDKAANGSAASTPVTVTTQSNPQLSCAGSSAYICDDFSAGASDFTTAGGTWATSGGLYNLTSPATATDANTLLYNQALNNKSVNGDFTMSFNGSTSSTNAFADFGAIYDYTDSSNYYYIDYNHSDDSGTNGIFKVASGTQTKLADFPVTINPGTTYATKIVKTGSTVNVYRDNVLLASASDSTFTSGKVGLGSRNDPASFDSLVVLASPADTTAPSVPTGLTATAPSSSQVNLSWNASTDNVGVTGYRIYRNGASTPIATVTTTSYGDTGLAASTTYAYTVSAIDAAGNESAKTAATSVTTPATAGTVTLLGVVTNADNGNPIAGANVRTGKHGTKTGATQATTNASGQYILTNIIPTTKHNYNYSASGFKTRGFSLGFPAGTSTKNVVMVSK